MPPILKTSGLLKVPQNVLENVQNWVAGRYCKSILEHFQLLLDSQNKRKSHYFIIKDQLENILLGAGLLDAALNNNTDVAWEDFIYWAEKDNKISYFENGVSIKSYFRGVLIPSNTDFLTIKVVPNKENRYYKDKENHIFHITFFTRGKGINQIASFDALKAIFSQNRKIIYDALSYFDDFAASYELPDEQYLKDLKFCKAYCENASKNVGRESFTFFEFHLDNFPRKLAIKVKFAPYEKRREIYPFEDWIGLWYENGKSDWSRDNSLIPVFVGTVYATRNVEQDWINLYDNVSIRKLLIYIDDLKSVVRHELQHFIQTFIQRTNNLDQWGGMVGKKLRNNQEKTEPSLSTNEKAMLAHPLRDVEFYTLLSDDIEDFKKTVKYLPLNLHNYFFKYWVYEISEQQFRQKILEELKEPKFDYTNTVNFINDIINIRKHSNSFEFMKALKEHQPLKYQKALKEFFKAINV